MGRHKKSPPKGPAPEGTKTVKSSQARDTSYQKFSSCQERGRRKIDQIDIHKPGYWAVLPASVRYDHKLPAAAKLLYAEISSLAEATGYCFASNDYFMSLYAMSERTLQRHLKSLEAGGHITIVDGDGGACRRKIYAGANPLRENPVKNDGVDAGTPSKMSPNPVKNVAPTLNNKNNNNTPQSPPGGEGVPKARKRRRSEPKEQPDWKPARFNGFWNFYPVHKSKQSAIRAWDELKPSDELIAEIGKALRRQKTEDEWSRGIGIPYAATYLRQERWKDEPDRGPIADPDDGEEDLPVWTT